MKIVKIIFGIIGAVVAAAVVVGAIVQEFSYTNSVQIDAPVEKTFAVFTDASKLELWLEGYKSSVQKSGEAFEIGSVSELTFENQGETIVMLETLTAYEPKKRYAFDYDNDLMTGNVDIRFSSVGENQTEVEVDNIVRGKNILMRAMLYIMKGSIQGQAQQSYDNLKVLVEKTPDIVPESATMSEEGATMEQLP